MFKPLKTWRLAAGLMLALGCASPALAAYPD